MATITALRADGARGRRSSSTAPPGGRCRSTRSSRPGSASASSSTGARAARSRARCGAGARRTSRCARSRAASTRRRRSSTARLAPACVAAARGRSLERLERAGPRRRRAVRGAACAAARASAARATCSSSTTSSATGSTSPSRGRRVAVLEPEAERAARIVAARGTSAADGPPPRVARLLRGDARGRSIAEFESRARRMSGLHPDFPCKRVVPNPLIP